MFLVSTDLHLFIAGPKTTPSTGIPLHHLQVLEIRSAINTAPV